MFNFKKLYAVLFCALFLMQSSQALTLPYTNKVGSAVASLIAGKQAQRVTGIAMDSLAPAAMAAAIASRVADTGYQQTMQVASFVVTGMLSAAIATGTLPIWATIALGTAAAVTVPLAINGVVQWLIGTPPATPLTTTTATVGSDPSVQNSIPIQSTGYLVTYLVGNSIGKDFTVITYTAPTYFYTSYFSQTSSANINRAGWMSQGTAVVNSVTYYYWKGPTTSFSVPCQSNYTLSGSACVSTLTVSSNVTLPNQTVQQGIDALPPGELTKPVNPQLLADLANKIWAASSATPGTVPFDATRPITAADVTALKGSLDASGTGAYPVVGDFVAPGIPPVGAPVLPYTSPTTSTPGAVPGTVTTTQTTTDSAGNKTTSTSSSLIDWGVFTPPDLVAPTIESILDPIFNMWPAWKNFSFPSHSSVCPSPSFTLPASLLGGRTITLDSVCTWVEQIRGPMQAAFVVAWSIVIVLVVMGA